MNRMAHGPAIRIFLLGSPWPGIYYSALYSRALLGGLAIQGPDEVETDSWVKSTVDQMQARKIGLYDMHRYAWSSDLRTAARESVLQPVKQYVVAGDPQGAAKRLYIAEAGMLSMERAGTRSPTGAILFSGVWMADYMASLIRAGAAGCSVWDLDDALHQGGGYGSMDLKGWGFWNSLGGQYGFIPRRTWTLRPWFYTWSLMSRNFPRGGQSLLFRGSKRGAGTEGGRSQDPFRNELPSQFCSGE